MSEAAFKPKPYTCTLPSLLRSKAPLDESKWLQRWNTCKILVLSPNVVQYISSDLHPFGSRSDSDRGVLYQQAFNGGETKLVETVPASEWNEKQKEEFKVRLAAQANWDQAELRSSGFFSKNVLGRTYARETQKDENKPDAVVISTDSSLQAIEFAKRVSQKNNIPVVFHDPKSPDETGTKIRKAVKENVLKTALNDIKDEYWKKGYDNGYTVGYGIGYQLGSLKTRAGDNSRKLGDSFGECLCPLSRQPLREAVMTPSGNTYEKHEIESHIRSFGTDPASGQPLNMNELRPNTSLQNLCSKLLSSSLFTSN